MTKLKSIPNTKLEEMFLRVATDTQIRQYNVLVEKDLNAPATTMATKLVFAKFMDWADRMESSLV